MPTADRSPVRLKRTTGRQKRKGKKATVNKRSLLRIGWIALALVAIFAAILFVSCEGEQESVAVPETPTASLPRQTATPGASTTASHAIGLSDAGSLPNVGAQPKDAPPPQVYTVSTGDTLSDIARRFGCDLDNLIKDNQIADPNILRVGQKLGLSSCQIETGPTTHLLPNSEFVNGPAYVNFDVAAFSARQGGYLANFQGNVGGQILSGPEIVSLVAQRYSVGPRMLLAILELKSGWVTDPNPDEQALSFPMGYKGGGWDRFYWQMAWAADELNRGYYDWRGRGMAPIIWRDGTSARYAPTLNAATAGLQYFFSLKATESQWSTLIGEGPDSFIATYGRLFGDPARYAVEPLIPANTTQPPLTLPWSKDELWYYTSGPHGGWEEGSAWAALDFAPNERGLGCRAASSWATAVAAGLVIHSQDGEVIIDLDGDGHEETGWVLFYLHLASQGRVPVGARVKQGDPIGHPSCEGGLSEATHLHLARKYNGEWIAADGPLPFVLSGWQFHSSGTSYDGTATRGDQERTACECWLPDFNGLVADR